MPGVVARDEDVAAWLEDGWVLLDGLVGTDEIDAAVADLRGVFPTPDQYHADPVGETERWLGRPRPPDEPYVWPPDGPGFRPEQHRWSSEFPFPGTGALNRLLVHPAIVDFAERALQTTDLRLYQSQVSAKFTGLTNYEQPLHTDRNHSWLPPVRSRRGGTSRGSCTCPTSTRAPRRRTWSRCRDAAGRATTVPLVMPDGDPALYAAERPAPGIRGSLLAYRPDVFHRAVDLTQPGGARYLLNVSFKVAGEDWIGYHTAQSRATDPAWVAFVEASSPRDLALLGFPPPGHPIWTAALLDATADRYPKLNLTAWRAALDPPAS